MSTLSLSRIDDTTYLDLAAGHGLPLEQLPAWDRYEDALPGHAPFGRFLWRDSAGAPRALISLTRMEGRGFTYLWAKKGPVWLGERPTASEELEFRTALGQLVRRADRGLAFMRIHAWHRAPDLHELLQTVTYDRTVVVDVARPDAEIRASFSKSGRRQARKAEAEGLEFCDETERAREVFPELYAILTETATRDDFGAAPMSQYVTMLESLGPDHARLFVARAEGRALAWQIVLATDDLGEAYYGATNAEARQRHASMFMDLHTITWLRETGRKAYDLMGVHSERAPQLEGVTGYKQKFAAEFTEVAGAWDVPLRPRYYRGLKLALRAKRSAVGAVRASAGAVRGVRERLGRRLGKAS
ncbi:lipid II:glycine glycyltransferase FemX [Actinotignum schaalii]|uniref:BioF2-like acetyltransferase domain-containing protein n=1 Tax=Actinotignum schaalii FB123-CNA-2 TaxID=883067 RepID=S2VI21_9ACTO|nr:GNAT family N-acetyltransferase [Actinotignum schaalii]EPD27098.1 hypothetical protein HMPREF9237_01035 [Actinotignum schaalii FB123-CNA-2]